LYNIQSIISHNPLLLRLCEIIEGYGGSIQPY